MSKSTSIIHVLLAGIVYYAGTRGIDTLSAALFPAQRAWAIEHFAYLIRLTLWALGYA